MAIDTDIQSFSEYNANCSDENTKLTQLTTLVANTALTSVDNNKIPVRRSGVWSIEGEEAYNGYYQDFGNISGSVVLAMNGDSCRTAMIATVDGNTFVTGFGANFATGVVYLLLIKQNATGGYTVRWPYGASVLKQVGTSPNQMTEVYIVKLPSGKIFIKCEAFQNTTQIGAVIKEFEFPNITYPDSALAPMSFTWTKSSAIGYGGTVSGLYSDWEIADDSLYTNLLFSSYNNSTDLYAIQVILTQAGTVYMRTRHGGTIGGTPVVSDWDEAVVELSGIDGDKYWDQVVLCINANKYGWEGSRKIVDEKGFNQITLFGDVKVTDSSGKWAINFDGSGDFATIPASSVINLSSLNWTIEFFAQINSYNTSITYSSIILDNDGGTANWQIFIDFTGNLKFYVQGVGILSGGVPIVVGQKKHYSIVRNGSSLLFFVNGVPGTSGTINNTLSVTGNISFFKNGTYYTNTLLHSLRITKNICRYTTNFNIDLTKPYFDTGNLWWTPEPKYISNEKFLDYVNWDKTVCCINGYGVANSTAIADSAGNSITLSGDTKIAVTNNISYINFDGSGDTLNFPFSLSYLVGNYDFCLEFFYRAGSTTTGTILSDASSFGGYCSLRVDSDTSGTRINVFLYDSTATLINIVSSVLTTYGNIVHVALVRNGTSILLFINGASAGSSTITAGRALYTAPANLKLGLYGSSQYFTGGIYSFRISMFARYTAPFTAPDLTRPYFITKPKVENWAETSLVVNAYNLPINSTDIRDAKGNAISLYGDTKIGVDSSGLQYINFDGTGDSLGVVGINTDASEFTLELFCLRNVSGGGYTFFDSRGSDNSTTGFCFYVDASNRLVFGTGNPITTVQGSGTITTSLVHIALVREASNVFKWYLNGIYDGTRTVSATFSNSTARVGSNWSVSADGGGKVYAARLIKGKALYTSNFNVDLTNPYFPAIDSISDLWIDGNDYSKMTLATGVSKIVDKSGNLREAAQGTAANQPALVQNVQNGLMGLSFDGTDDFLDISLGSVKFKNIFMVVKKTSASNEKGTVFRDGGYVDKDGFLIESDGDTNLQVSNSGGSAIYPGPKIGVGDHHLIDLVCDGTSRYIYIDGGSLSGSAANTNPIVMSQLGKYHISTYSLEGYISDIVCCISDNSNHHKNTIRGFLSHKWGLTANLPANHPYKTSYPVEDVRTDDYWYATVLCINGTDIIRPTEIVDSSNNNKITVYGDTKALIDSNNLPYINFDGSGDYLQLAPTTGIDFGTGDFTVEVFISFASVALAEQIILGRTTTWISNVGFLFEVRTSDVRFYAGNNIPLVLISSTGAISANTIHHIAVSRYNGTTKIFVNGVSVASSSSAATISNTGSIRVGNDPETGTSYLNGKIYSIRVTKGIARYTSNFSVDLAKPYFPKLQNKDNIIPILKPDAWFDGDDSATITVESTGRVSKWADKSGNNYHATMVTDAYRPVLTKDVIGGKDALYFDGATRFLQLGTVLGKPANFTVFVVGVFHSQPSKVNMCGSGNSAGSSATYWGDIGIGRTANDGKVEYSISDGSNYAYGRTTNGVIVTNEWFCGGWIYVGGNKPIWYQKGLEKAVTLESGTATTNSGTAAGFSLGRAGDYNGQYLNGKIAEVLIFRRGLSYNEMLLVSEYLENKWFAPGTWTPGMIATALWLDASDSTTIVLNGSTVSQWSDKSGNGRHAVQGTATNQPTAITNGIQFDGVDNYLGFSSAIAQNTTTLLMVIEPTIEAAIGMCFGQWGSGVNGRLGMTCNQDAQSESASAGFLNPFISPATSGGAPGGWVYHFPITNTPTIIEFTVNISAGTENYKSYKNGQEQDSATVTAVATGINSSLGSASSVSATFPYDGKIREVVVLHAVNDDNRQRIEGYLAHKWDKLLGTTTLRDNLHPGHPYKTVAP